MANFRLSQQPVQPAPLEAIALSMQDIGEPFLGVHARVVSELRALDEGCMRVEAGARGEISGAAQRARLATYKR